MSYDIAFKVKVEGLKNRYVDVGDCNANITWNVRKIIVLSTGLEWRNEDNNGLCKHIIPKIKQGLEELNKHPQKYKKYESPNGWGTIEGVKRFFSQIILDWDAFCNDSWLSDLQDVTYFWIC